MKYHLLLIIFLFSITVKAQENVELVISSGLVYTTSTSFSHNSKYLVNVANKNVYIRDVKTGREIRQVQVTTNNAHMVDSAWFSADDKTIIVGLMMNNDNYHIDVSTGESVWVKSDTPYDYTQPFHKSVGMKNNEHMASDSKKDLVYYTPDGKTEVRLRKVKNKYDLSGTVPHLYMPVLVSGSKETAQADTSYLMDIAFSKDSKLVYVNK
ncbi:MAG: hypothetical protein JKY54_11990, partial [Flavobacteriales bacterium]|nr:hypothetical protein [Flavobacteriales bacterium]